MFSLFRDNQLNECDNFYTNRETKRISSASSPTPPVNTSISYTMGPIMGGNNKSLKDIFTLAVAVNV